MDISLPAITATYHPQDMQTAHPDVQPHPSSPRTRPSFLHRSSASIDSNPSSSRASPSIVHPLSPPLPPASFNPPPDIHPLLRAATQSDESHGIREDTGLSCVVSPLDEPSPDGSPMIGLGPSILPPPTQYFPFPSGPLPIPTAHPSPLPDQIDTLQRRLSEKRRKHSSGSASRGRTRAGSAGREPQAAPEPRGDLAGDGEREEGHEEAEAEGEGKAGLRGAREALQAVLEEALKGMPSAEEAHADSGVGSGDSQQVVKPSVTNDTITTTTNAIASTSVSFQSSPVLSPAPTPSSHPNYHTHATPLSFEDLVRHKRRGSITALTPSHSLTGGSGPTTPRVGAGGCPTHAHGGAKAGPRQAPEMMDPAEVKLGSSPLSATERRTSVDELIKMPRSFSGEVEWAGEEQSSMPAASGANIATAIGVVPSGTQGTAQEIIAPASILQVGGSADDATTATGQDARETGATSVGGRLGGSGDDPERMVAGAGLDTLIDTTAEVAAMTTRTDPPVSSPSDAAADTHLWDSVWPSATSPTHAIEPRGVSYPKPMSDPRRSGSGALRPRLPMHSRTSSMSIHSFSESSVASSSSSSYTSPGLPMHSFSYPRPRPDDPPSPAPAAYPRTGIPLFFSEALTASSAAACAPPAWAQHPSARRGSLASLGTWPLKRENSVGVGAAGAGTGPERRQSIREGKGAEGRRRGGERVIEIAEGSDDDADDTRRTEA